MTRDEAKKILGEEATEEQVTNLLNNYHAQESNKVKELEDKINSLTEQNSKYSDYDDIKQQRDDVQKQLDDINNANLSEQEKLAKKQAEIEQNLTNSRKIYNTAKAKEILAGLNLDDETIELVVTDDEATTIAKANNLKAKFDSMKETVAKETKESLMNNDLKPGISNVKQTEGDDVMTFEKFGEMSADEQNKWIDEHPEEFENL